MVVLWCWCEHYLGGQDGTIAGVGVGRDFDWTGDLFVHGLIEYPWYRDEYYCWFDVD